MNNQSIFQPIFQYVRTTHEADELIMHIDNLLKQYYTVQKDPFERIAYAVLEPAIAGVIQNVFTQRNLNWNHFEEVKMFLTELKVMLQQSDILTLTLPNTASGEEITDYCTWARTNVAPNILLELHTDPTIIGGAVVIYKGHYIDQSIKKKVKSYFQTQKSALLSRIRKPQQAESTQATQPVRQPNTL